MAAFGLSGYGIPASGGDVLPADDPGAAGTADVGQREIGAHVFCIDAAGGTEGHVGEGRGIGLQARRAAVLFRRKEFQESQAVLPGRFFFFVRAIF